MSWNQCANQRKLFTLYLHNTILSHYERIFVLISWVFPMMGNSAFCWYGQVSWPHRPHTWLAVPLHSHICSYPQYLIGAGVCDRPCSNRFVYLTGQHIEPHTSSYVLINMGPAYETTEITGCICYVSDLVVLTLGLRFGCYGTLMYWISFATHH